jgi:predicted DNA-binding transcriptional regulator YafY
MNRIARLFAIHDSLSRGDAPRDAREWGADFRVNVRTVLRDMAFLKKEFKLPLIFDPALKGYRYDGTNPRPMPEVKQPKWTRLLTLIHRIYAEPGKTAKELSDVTGRDERTIYRDIKALDEAGFPVYNDNGYRFATDAFMPAFNLTTGEIFSLFVAVRLLESQDVEQLGAEGRRALEKLLRGMAEHKRSDLGHLRDAVQVYEVTEDTGASQLGEMQSALSQGRQIVIHYRGMKDDQAKPRRLDPMGLFCFRQVWYLHAYDHERQDLRNFRLSRIEKTERSNEPILHEPKMEIQEASYHKWDAQGQAKQTVRIKVTQALRRWLDENPAHPTQVLSEHEVTYHVANPIAMGRWVTSLYGLEVIEPKELKDELSRISRELIELYGEI